MINIDINIAIPKLKRVPNRIYSVNFRSLDSFKSPNLKTDFAGNISKYLSDKSTL